jgi:hypothetical protein
MNVAKHVPKSVLFYFHKVWVHPIRSYREFPPTCESCGAVWGRNGWTKPRNSK